MVSESTFLIAALGAAALYYYCNSKVAVAPVLAPTPEAFYGSTLGSPSGPLPVGTRAARYAATAAAAQQLETQQLRGASVAAARPSWSARLRRVTFRRF